VYRISQLVVVFFHVFAVNDKQKYSYDVLTELFVSHSFVQEDVQYYTVSLRHMSCPGMVERN
jgi:hypothetical protein